MITASSRRTPGPIRSAVSVRVKRSWPTLRFTRNAWGYGSRRSPGRRGFGLALLLLRRCPLHESLAALHLVGQRRLVDLDHDGIGVDAEVLHERLRMSRIMPAFCSSVRPAAMLTVISGI